MDKKNTWVKEKNLKLKIKLVIYRNVLGYNWSKWYLYSLLCKMLF